MTKKNEGATGADATLSTVTRLVTVAEGDTLYRDVYLRRAAELLAPTVTQERYEVAVKSADQAKKMLAQARAAVNRQDWEQVQQLSTAAAAIQRSLDAEQGSLSAAEAVYAAA